MLAPTTLVVGVLGIAPAVEVELDRLGVELRPVVELDALAQFDGVGAAAVLGFRNLGGEGRCQIEALWFEAEQGIQDLAGSPEGLAVGGVDGVQADRVREPAEDEGAASASTAAYGPAAAAPGQAEQRHAGQAGPAQPEEVAAAYLPFQGSPFPRCYSLFIRANRPYG